MPNMFFDTTQTFTPRFNKDSTFYPDFGEAVHVYEGIEAVWIGGTGEHPEADVGGALYVQYSDGVISQVGLVSDYYYALSTGAFSGTFSEWVDLIISTANNAIEAKQARNEARQWATGNTTGTYTTGNSAKEQADRAKQQADSASSSASSAAGSAATASQQAGIATTQASNAANSATNAGLSATAALNAKTAAETAQSKAETAQTKAETAQGKAETAQGKAETAQGKAETAQTKAETAQSLSEAAKRATETAQSKAETAQAASETAQQAAETAQGLAENAQAASETAQGAAETAQGLAENAKTAAETARNESRQWATGNTSGTYTTGNSAKEQAELAARWATGDTTGTPTQTNNAKAYSETADRFCDESESWAKGTKNNVDVPSTDPAYHNNSKYWAEQSKTYSDGKNFNNTDVRAADNAKYYKDEAKAWAGSTSEHASATDNSKYYSEQSKLWANNASDGDTPSSTNNAKAYSQAANEFEKQAESWAQGTRDGATDTTRQDASTKNSKAYSDVSLEYRLQSESWAVGTRNNSPDTIRENATTNNAKKYAETSHAQAILSQEAKEAAINAKLAAEEAISHNPRINQNDNWEIWDIQNEEWQDTGHKSMAYASIGYAYQNSTNGTTPPTGTWDNTPDPQKGKYLWTRMTYTWTNGRIDNFYNVSYIGVDGAVISVNGLHGDVVLDGTNIYVNANVQEKETVFSAISRLGTAITNSEIDSLFNVD